MLAILSKQAYYSSMTIENPLLVMDAVRVAYGQNVSRYEVLAERQDKVGRLRGLVDRGRMLFLELQIEYLEAEYESAEHLYRTGEHPAIPPTE